MENVVSTYAEQIQFQLIKHRSTAASHHHRGLQKLNIATRKFKITLRCGHGYPSSIECAFVHASRIINSKKKKKNNNKNNQLTVVNGYLFPIYVFGNNS